MNVCFSQCFVVPQLMILSIDARGILNGASTL
jgi:hypothetical protein